MVIGKKKYYKCDFCGETKAISNSYSKDGSFKKCPDCAETSRLMEKFWGVDSAQRLWEYKRK